MGNTIAAVATAMSESGIGIIRVSGDDAVQIVHGIYRTKSGKKMLSRFASHTVHYGFIVDNENGREEVIDEVMVSVMKAPRSYTAEDTVEINCHGGILVLRRVLEAVLKHGARLAQPGEFTKRAFLNGRMDLSKAEAVIDIIHSKNQYALKSSVSQLRGSVSDMVKGLREELLYEIAFIESALDDPEHISLDGYAGRLMEKTENIILRLEKLLDHSAQGRILKEGINTVIVGKPNAGKSSLLNLLVGEDKAIVTDVAGTTRDVLEENIRLQGISLNVIDTAGIRFTEDTVEKIGVEKAKKYALDADLLIYVVDGSVPLDESDYEILNLISGKKVIILLNKTDLDMVVTEDILLSEIAGTCKDVVEKASDIMIIRTSTKENTGIDIFADKVKEMFFGGEISFNDEMVITNMRHREAMQDACESMRHVKESLESNMPEDFYSIDLMNAYTFLGTIIGEEVGEDLVNEIFSKFCMGK